ncbi:hypothetical protein BKA61DRAFT_681401 [Leptodontidium sp. MPI-SDFR-AT-0119]|nr:hypothetical protein BKA61DRAFT_681401 [Leptodontidium sp. MPI-SDFR-AT-0119]
MNEPARIPLRAIHLLGRASLATRREPRRRKPLKLVSHLVVKRTNGCNWVMLGYPDWLLGGESALVFEIADYFLPSDSHVLLVRNARFGAALASLFSSNNSDMNSASPTNNVVLMRGHDMAVIGLDIVTAVFRAIYTQSVAEIRRDALILSALGCTDGQPPGKSRRIRYLTEREKHDTIALDTTFFNRAWELWVREVDAAATGELYRNSLGSPL